MSGTIKNSALSEGLKKNGLAIIRGLFEAEATVHGLQKIEEVHLHELGSADTIIDVMGSLICLELLNVEAVYSSAVNLGGGTVRTLHGRFGVPAPATALLLEGAPVYGSSGSSQDISAFELTTPTGAALMKGLSKSFGPMPSMRLEKSGAGAGEKDPAAFPNVLRVFIGEAYSEQKDKEAENTDLLVIETNIDDMNPQIYGYLLEKLLKAGALDAFLTPIIMKKGRPAIKLSVLCEFKNAALLKETIFRETTTLGVRFYPVGRSTIERRAGTLETEFGPVRFKTAFRGDRESKAPEYEDCLKIAKKTGLSLKEIMDRLMSV